MSTKAEFDAYAAGYTGGMDNPLKRVVGASPEQFLEVKARWLLDDWRSRRAPRGRDRFPALLDYGCGVGGMLKVLRRMGFEGSLTGCDISSGMLGQARRFWDDSSPLRLDRQDGVLTPYPDTSFDLIVVSAVLHHVPPAERPGLYREVARLLRPGGRLYVFEHNPWNPVTQWVVRHTPIDRDAILLSARGVVRSLRTVAAGGVKTRYLMFFPPVWTWARRLEGCLGRVPLGGQYVVRWEKPAS